MGRSGQHLLRRSLPTGAQSRRKELEIVRLNALVAVVTRGGLHARTKGVGLVLLVSTVLAIGAACSKGNDIDERIAFMSNRSGRFDIYVMNADGSGLKRLTDHPAADINPALSPDGKRIAFTSERDEDAEVYVMNIDGSGLVRLTTSLGVVLV
jgi:dipeptidyl aminopeptidase/acylaminoacyl peptidase